jgi:adenine-specific DNA-methyltransferase
VQHADKFADIEHNLRMIQTLRSIALDLIAFLAQLEDFQKKLWLKKKFVVAAHYCITLDRIIKDAPDLLNAIAANPKQWDQWEKLGMLDGKTDLLKQAKDGSIEYLKENPYLMADTALFDVAFKHTLLATVDNLDETTNGLLIHGDNFQALNLLQERYRKLVQCIYIDPPYNTGGDGFVYKDNYQHSSWMSMIKDRMNSLANICSDESVLFSSIDDNEVAIFRLCLDEIFGTSSFESQTIIQSNKRGQTYQKVAKTHEYLLIYIIGVNADLSEIDKKISDSSLADSIGPYELWELRNRNPKFGKHNRPNLYYPIYVDIQNSNSDGYVKISLERSSYYSFEVYPKNSGGSDSCWRWGKDKLLKAIADGSFNVVIAKQKRDGGWNIYEKSRKSSTKAKSMWVETEVINEQGTVEVGNLGFTDFGFPKPTGLLKKILKVGSLPDEIVLDYFAGSGTTGHAVINLNREDNNGNRKYILVEQGEYFDTVLKPRIQKVVYSADWKDGKPTAPHTGISHAFKVLKIESYEDTLNNLQMRRTQAQQHLLNDLPQSAQEDYLLRYLLDIESRGSLLSVEQFNKPFDCKLKVTVDSAGAYEERTIDLVETFNFLIGLRVKQIDMQMKQGFVLVTGSLPTGEKTLVLWRDVERIDYESLNRLCDKLAINPADSEYEVVYINGDHNIPIVFTSLEAEGGITKTLKIRQIEPEFLSRMFAGESL